MGPKSRLAGAAMLLTAVATAALGAESGDSQAYHVFPTPALRATQPKPLLQPGTTPPTLLYYGGPVLAKVKVVAVMWGANVNPTTSGHIGSFLAALVNSTFIDQLKQYATNRTGTNGHAGTNQTIGRGSFAGKFMITPKNTSSKISDAAIQAELRGQIFAGKLPKPDANTLYMVYFPVGITISSYGKSCVGFAAYHSAASASAVPNNLFYGVMPDCHESFAGMTVTTSHELAEAVSDAIPTPGSNPAYPQAWNTHDGYEVADLCERTTAVKLVKGSQSYSITRVFLNGAHRCSGGTFTSP